MSVYLYSRILILTYESFAYSNIISVETDKNCLFRAVSYCMYNIEDGHSEVRINTLNKINNEWEYYTYFIVHLSTLNIAEDYWNSLSWDEEDGGDLEFTYISRCSECSMKIAPVQLLIIGYINSFSVCTHYVFCKNWKFI